MMRILNCKASLFIELLIFSCFALGRENGNRLEDPSFEMTKDKDQFGLVFAKWGGWKYEGDCEFRVGKVAHGGKHSCLLFGGSAPKIRVAQNVALGPGRYRIAAYVRGLDIGTGTYGMSTEFMFDGNYIPLGKKGTFGWTRLTYVAEVKEKKQAGPSLGLMAPGYFWIDDVSLEKVGNDVALTEKPVLGAEERRSRLRARSPPRPSAVRSAGTATVHGRPATPAARRWGRVGGHRVGPIGQVDRHLRGANPFSGGVVVGALARGPQGAAARPLLCEHGSAPGLARLRPPQGRDRLRSLGADGPVRRDPGHRHPRY